MSNEKYVIFYRDKRTGICTFERLVDSISETIDYLHNDNLIKNLSNSQNIELVVSKTDIILSDNKTAFKITITDSVKEGV